eukprot:COSAG02_NODE_4375_length_5437_cov_7.337580_5_plen_74_part_00
MSLGTNCRVTLASDYSEMSCHRVPLACTLRFQGRTCTTVLSICVQVIVWATAVRANISAAASAKKSLTSEGGG